MCIHIFLSHQLDPDGFDTGAGSFDTDETRVFARLADARHPVPPCLLSYGVAHDPSVPATPGRCFTERVSIMPFLISMAASET